MFPRLRRPHNFFWVQRLWHHGDSSPTSREEERKYWMEHRKESRWREATTAISNSQVAVGLPVQEIVAVLKRTSTRELEDQLIKRFTCLLLGLFTMIGRPSILLAQQSGYKQTNLTANVAGVANHTDSQLSNPWGISFLPSYPFWIAHHNTATSPLSHPHGNQHPLAATLPR